MRRRYHIFWRRKNRRDKGMYTKRTLALFFMKGCTLCGLDNSVQDDLVGDDVGTPSVEYYVSRIFSPQG
jgi:hypothetical protein